MHAIDNVGTFEMLYKQFILVTLTSFARLERIPALESIWKLFSCVWGQP